MGVAILGTAVGVTTLPPGLVAELTKPAAGTSGAGADDGPTILETGSGELRLVGAGVSGWGSAGNLGSLAAISLRTASLTEITLV